MDEILKNLLAVRSAIASRLDSRLEQGEQLAHTAYLGLVALARHEWVPIIAGFGFILIVIHYLLAGFGE